MKNIFGFILIVLGTLGIFAAYNDWDWWMKGFNSRLIVYILGRNGARLFYGIFATGLVVLGFLIMTGIIQL